MVGGSDEHGEVSVENSNAELDRKRNRRLNRKLDLQFLPLWLLAPTAELPRPRGNIGNARILNQETGDGLMAQTRMMSQGYAITLTLFSVAYAVFEFPSNWVMKHYVRPSLWLAFLLIFRRPELCTILALRLMIGVMSGLAQLLFGYRGVVAYEHLNSLFIRREATFEAGFFPGIAYVITIWYRHNGRDVCIALAIAFCSLAGAFGDIIAYGIGRVNGAGDLEGFRWLFIIEGIITILSVLPTILILPDYPSRDEWWNDPRMLAHYFAYIANVVVQGSFTFFAPTIGYQSVQAQFMTVPPWVVDFFVAIALSYSADHFDARRWHIAGASTAGGVGWLTARLLPHDAYAQPYGCLCLAAAGASSCAPSMMNLVTCNTPSLLTIPFVIALRNSCAGIGQIIA
ncbi:hypothetical protein DL764_003834 [Monosporascus ibericus]|uniref:Major facilitator superfamily (MFS) profile domain-containing protein n=1 Tax=Monosporascus ibericus TaxID=155417 RepID=A0A4V1XB89_9PEZI|nr:hypothetical protein DL764_003834 [Monosporascus ibericus]